LHSMLRISSLSIPARGRTSRLTANCLPIFSIWFENCRAQAVRAGESGIRLIFEMRIAAPGPRFFKPFSALRLMGVLSSVVAKIGRPRRARFRCLRRFGRRNLQFLVARGLRILLDFAGLCRGK
jgi:hypothetical protein